MAIPRFTPSDLGGQNFTHDPGSVATAIESSFYRAQENVRQNEESDRADTRLAMQQQEQGLRLEETEYQRTLRPLREQSMQLGVASQGLQIANQAIGLQSAQIGVQSEQMRLGQQEQEMNFLTGNLSWMNQQSQPATGGVPTTSYSFGADVGGPDEMQDKWTNRGYSSTGKNLTPGVVAVNTNRYPLGTVFKDQDSGETFLAADRHGNKDQEVVDIFQEPGSYKPTSARRNLTVVGKVDKVPDTPEGVKQVLSRFQQTDGTGVPSLSQVAAATTPTGVPVIAAAANSLDPQAVITQSFAPDQQQALARYDRVTALAQAGSTPQARSMAAQEMVLMQNDPRMAATLAQRQEMIRSTQAQVQVQGMLQSAPDDMVKGFESRYGSKYRMANIDGRQVPLNAQGKPLNSNDYASFSRAFTDYAETYKFDPQAATTELRTYEAAIPKLAQIAAFQREAPPSLQSFLAPGGGDPLTPEDGKAYEAQLKAYNDALGNYTKQSQATRQMTAELAIQAGRNPSIARAMVAMFPAPVASPATAEAASQTPSARPTLDQLARGRTEPDGQQSADNDVWTNLKTTLNQNLELEGFADSGSVSPDNAALQLAARIHKGDTEAIDQAAKTFGKRMSDTLGTVGGDSFFKKQSIQPRQVARAWAEDLLTKYGYLSKPAAKGAAAPSRIRSITPVN